MSLKPKHDAARAEILVIGVRRASDEYVMAVIGELDLSGVERMWQAFSAALESDAPAIVLDLRELEFLDSAGLHTIIRAERAAREQRKSFVIVRGPRQVQRLFEITGLDGRMAFSDGSA